ncbi:retrotransposon gag domain-containing protein [Salmonella enterica]|nr:retrotransposon gag domain-containing protein [Salmonella enterica]
MAAAATQNTELVALIAALREQVEAQAVELRRMREERAQGPTQPPIPAAVPRPVPAAPVVAPIAVPPPVQLEPLYVRFQKMKPPVFEGSSDPLAAEGWLTTLQDIMRFMGLNEQEKVLCASFVLRQDARFWWDTVAARKNIDTMIWSEFLAEFRKKYCDPAAMRSLQNEFNKFRQGDLSVNEAVRRFDQLARLCPSMVTTEEERVRRLMDMFRSDIALIVDSGEDPPLTSASCISRALRAEHRLKQDK